MKNLKLLNEEDKIVLQQLANKYLSFYDETKKYVTQTEGDDIELLKEYINSIEFGPSFMELYYLMKQRFGNKLYDIENIKSKKLKKCIF